MSDRVLLGIADDELLANVSASIAESAGLEVVAVGRTAPEIVSACEDGDVDVVLLHEDVGPLPLLHLTRDLGARFPAIGVVLLVTEPSADLLRGALQAGARGVTALPLSLDALESDLTSAAAWARSVRSRFASNDQEAAAPSAAARMFALAGAKGGVGASTIALHLALEAADTFGSARSVCLVDLDLQTGDMANLLDLEHRRSIIDLLEVADDLTPRHIEEAVYRHPSGLHVLLAPDEGEQGEHVTATHARQILGALRSRFDLVIVDVGSVVTEAALIATEMADQVLVVTTPDVPAMRSANRLLELWRRLEARTDGIGTVVNRASRMSDVQPDLVASVVAAPRVPVTIPASYKQLQPAVNSGAPERAGGSPVHAGVVSLGAQLGLWPPRNVASGRRRLFGRRGESGQAAVEFVGMLPFVLLIAALAFQLVLLGMTFVFSGVAASEAARGLAVGDPVSTVQARVEDRLPGRWSSSLVLSPGGSGCHQCAVEASLRVPTIVPGVSVSSRVRSSSGYVAEEHAGGDLP